ncbi:MAG TPA: glutamate synthase large subunit [Gemmatimonadales bacterium]|jgi:glutamate synthase domain-containing protein 2/glutamate synthase domain-containing protein 1/glutamate synthase domain-containing protein 3
MAAAGQRIHPAGSRRPDPHAASAPSAALDPNRQHDACGVGLVACASGARSHDVVSMALEAVARVAHRGAASTDNSGDGAGLLTQIPHRLFYRDAYRLGLHLQPGLPFGVGAFFLPREPQPLGESVKMIERILAEDGIPFLGWRDVPTQSAALGPTALASCPVIRQVLVGRPALATDEDAWERALYLARREMERQAEERNLPGFYVCSLSCRTIVYKALLTGTQLPAFFTDFRYPEYESAIAVFHQRYSTNTLPSWPLAQPFRLLAHNGEINTLWGNRNAMTMRQPMLASPVWGQKIERLREVIWAEGSDSASLDNAMELLVRSGREPVHASMMMIPQAWEKYADLDPAIKAFYEYHQCVLEPWDGPAALAFTDGVIAGAAVDRNGLRPCRYKVRRDGLVVAGSEVGLVDLDPREVVECGKVGPGEVLVVDTRRGQVIRNLDAKREVAARKPYARWVARYMATLVPDPARVPPVQSGDDLLRSQRAFGYGFEDLRLILEPMGTAGADPVWSMGDDTPIPPLSAIPQSLYAYFRQRFAQVTNPPIDSLRETMVMSLRMHLGRRGSPLLERASYARMLRLEHPILIAEEMAALRNVAGFSTVTLDAVWDASKGVDGLRPALTALRRAAERAARRGARILVISDRTADRRHAPIPMLLAIGAVRQHLVHTGLRARVGLVAEVGDAFDIHHFATLIGYGAEAIHPWLGLATIDGLFAADEPGHARRRSREPEDEPRPSPEEARVSYRAAAEKGLLKILSKMGISTLSSYCGAQIFEVLGLGHEVIETCFDGTASPIGGIGFEEIAEDVLARHRAAYPDEVAAASSLPDHGRVRFRKEGEDHGWAPPVVVALQQAVKAGAPEAYGGYLVKNGGRRPAGPRDLLTVRRSEPVPLEEVEPAESIRRRFISSAMSLGALSPEAHATLSVAMNRMGARSNSGEGGEDPQHYHGFENGDRADNRIKQVASARFGVTTEYLMRAEELEIKIVQGAKPGEGGQLPAHKVTELIARLRHAVPGIQLISPPPHHDIYSIEDLAQLIHDLKTVNPHARVGVKLVSETGVGTVAAGVAKAYADYVLIAGHNGGTGASPLSSIKHSGSPWELGLAEAQTILVRNGLRHRIEVRTDGGLKTGRDVVIAALLGAESYGFGTAPLVAMGCAMARQCHINTCPTGIATQREDLRAKFKGTPEQVITYFTLLAEEVREILATMGARTLDEIIGRNDLLERVERPDVPRAQMLDLSVLMAPADEDGRPRRPTGVLRRTEVRNDRPGLVSLDAEILSDLGPYLESGLPFSGSYPIYNHHLTVGARVAGAIAERHGDAGLPPGSVRLRFTGTAGQSFGAFTCRGMHLELEGEANDYVGKGLSGGEITVRPFRRANYADVSHQHLILGNTILYGATGGKLFAAGQAGDRFAVRNSGAVAVIEGAGNHCCEYMTGGIVVVLGRAGRNFGAGMSNGVAYVLDETGTFENRVNPDMVQLDPIDEDDFELLQRLLREHEEKTVSPRARTILVQWADYRSLFRKVMPVGAFGLVAAAREAYLRSPQDQEVELARRSA